jgi:acetyl-CoA carboxylase carboxyl transferase subunit alpha
VISPEGCASILWRDAAKNEEAAETLKMQSEDLLEFGVIDEIIKEPQGGAHHDPNSVYEGVKSFAFKEGKKLAKIPTDELLEKRYQKFRKLGAFTVEEAAAE